MRLFIDIYIMASLSVLSAYQYKCIHQYITVSLMTETEETVASRPQEEETSRGTRRRCHLDQL